MTQQRVFVQNNNLQANQVLVYDRAANGTLTLIQTVDTGGKGGGSGSGPDPLVSQGSLIYDPRHRVVVAVNAGSDTVSVLKLEDGRLSLSQVLPSEGTFPTSVSIHGALLYVLNSHGGGAITGYRIIDGKFQQIKDSTRVLQLTSGSAAQQLGFTPDGHHLVITTSANNGQIDVFTVEPDGRPSNNPMANPAGTPFPFGLTFDEQDHLVVADAAESTLTTYTVNSGGTITRLASQPNGQQAMCWVAAAAGNFYVANLTSDTVTGYHIDFAGTPTVFTQVNTRANPMDLIGTSDGEFLYVEVGGVGGVDGFQIKPDGTLVEVVTLNVAAGLQGIAAT